MRAKLTYRLIVSFWAIVQAIAWELGEPASAATLELTMSPQQWSTEGTVTFDAPDDSFPRGRMTIVKGSASPKSLQFGNGTIEFDAKISSQGPALGPNFQFRTDGPGTAELVYVRPSADCPVAADCLQYTPITHGLMMWDAYRNYQHSAPIVLDSWNHFKFVVSRSRMNVYVNHQAVPSLAVGQLEGDATSGTLRIDGAGSYANFEVTPGDVEGLPATPLPDPTGNDPNYVRRWLVSPSRFWPSVLDPSLHAVVGKSVTLADEPAIDYGWKDATVERLGFLNLSRRYGLETVGSKLSIVWARTHIRAARDEVKRVSIGWLDEVSVFVNGRPAFADRNLWDIAAEKKPPDGRLGIDNGHFDLVLRKGDNFVDVAIDDNVSDGNDHHFGWGLEMRLDDLRGVERLGY